jgi:hypothetical protein
VSCSTKAGTRIPSLLCQELIELLMTGFHDKRDDESNQQKNGNEFHFINIPSKINED